MKRDLRHYARQTNLRLSIGFILLLFIVGIGLIYFFIGPEPALMGVLCLLVGMLPTLLIGLLLWVIDKVVKIYRED